MAGGAAAEAAMAVPKVPSAVAQLLAAAKGTAAVEPQKGTGIAHNCSACGLKPGDDRVSSPSAMAAEGLLQAVGLQGVSWSRALLANGCCWMTWRLLVAGVLALPLPNLFSLLESEQLVSLQVVVSLWQWKFELGTMQLLLLPSEGLLPVLSSGVPAGSEPLPPLTKVMPAAGGLAAVPAVLSSLRLMDTAPPADLMLLAPGAGAGAAACLASAKSSVLAVGCRSGSKAMGTAPAAVVAVAPVTGEAAAVAGAAAVRAAAAAVAELLARLLGATGEGACMPQKGTAVGHSCSACGLKPGDDGISSPSVMAAEGLVQAVGLQGVSWSRALLATGCCWMTWRLLVAGVLALPMPRLFSLLESEQLVSLQVVVSLWQWKIELGTVQLLLLPSEGLLPVLSSGVPAGSEPLPPLTKVLPAAEGLAAVPAVPSSLRLMDTAPPADLMLLVPGASAGSGAAAAACLASAKASILAVGCRSGSIAMGTAPAAVVAVAPVTGEAVAVAGAAAIRAAAAAVAGAAAVRAAAAAVAELLARLLGATGEGACMPQKGTAIGHSCSACGLKGGDVGFTSPSSVGTSIGSRAAAAVCSASAKSNILAVGSRSASIAVVTHPAAVVAVAVVTAEVAGAAAVEAGAAAVADAKVPAAVVSFASCLMTGTAAVA